MDEESVQVHNVIEFSQNKEGNTVIFDGMDEPGRYFVIQNKSGAERQMPAYFLLGI